MSKRPEVGPGEKYCSRCQMIKRKDLDFFADRTRPGGRGAYCKVCECKAQVNGWRKRTVEHRLWWYAKQRAKKYGIPFTITEQDIVVPERCPVLGLKLEVAVGQKQPNSPSLDKLIPELGYVPGNVRVISMRANRVKGDASLNELERVTAWLRQTCSGNDLLGGQPTRRDEISALLF